MIGEDPNPGGQLTWEDILQKYCRWCKKYERPERKCTHCGTIYDYNVFGCKVCDHLIGTLIDWEKEHNQLLDERRKAKRKNEPTDVLDRKLSELFNGLSGLGSIACSECNRFWKITDEKFICNKCKEKM